LRDVLILIPCRNEEAMTPGIFKAISELDYPRDRLHAVLVDDGSIDGTGDRMREITAGCKEWSVLSLNQNKGKASALNQAICQSSFGEIIYVLDADHRPAPDALRRINQYFDDPRVSGVSGRLKAANPTTSPSAFYSTVESLVHQMVTMRAKDRLDLAPAMLGSNCAYRRSALAAGGGFRAGALLEDSDITLSFYLCGQKVRFADDAIAYHQMPESVQDYIKQHTRWSRGFNDVARGYLPKLLADKNTKPGLRAELLIFSAGYLDRLALLGAAALSIVSVIKPRLFRFPIWLPALTLILPWVQISAIFIEQRMPPAMWARLPVVPLYFILDIWSALHAMVGSIINKPMPWLQTKRVTAAKH
jgi:cellulose synthase/poly-beta-1,6-N-acetylglucosamine synthase-like glycosyltransferase